MSNSNPLVKWPEIDDYLNLNGGSCSEIATIQLIRCPHLKQFTLRNGMVVTLNNRGLTPPRTIEGVKFFEIKGTALHSIDKELRVSKVGA